MFYLCVGDNEKIIKDPACKSYSRGQQNPEAGWEEVGINSQKWLTLLQSSSLEQGKLIGSSVARQRGRSASEGQFYKRSEQHISIAGYLSG